MSGSNAELLVPGRPVEVSPAYSYLSDKLRRLSAGSLQCSLFCGGRGCKYENEGRWRDEDKALRGVFSHWVTPDILAMARPSTNMIQNCDLIEEFRRYLAGRGDEREFEKMTHDQRGGSGMCCWSVLSIILLNRCGIGSVINLQLPWEHAKCGPGIEQSSGFTYCPEDFMNKGGGWSLRVASISSHLLYLAHFEYTLFSTL